MKNHSITTLLMLAVAGPTAAQNLTRISVRAADSCAIGDSEAGAMLSASSTVTKTEASILGNGVIYKAQRWNHAAQTSASANLFGRSNEAAGISGGWYVANGRWAETRDYRTGQWSASKFVYGPNAGYSVTLRVAGIAEATLAGQGGASLTLSKRVSRTLFGVPRRFDVPFGGVTVDGAVTAVGGFESALAADLSTTTQPLVNVRAYGNAAGAFRASVDFIVTEITLDSGLRLGDTSARFTVTNNSIFGAVVSNLTFAITPMSVWAEVSIRIGIGWLSRTFEDTLFRWSAPAISVSRNLQ